MNANTSEDLVKYRASPLEQARIADILSLVSESGSSALDIGARDGFLSVQLAERYDSVVALDLEQPDVSHPKVRPLKGDARKLDFPDKSFDLVLCAEVLEHIGGTALSNVCFEMARVARRYVVVGVPYRQDLRVGKTTCRQCGKPNPPWGHVNRFDEATLRSLFPDMTLRRASFVGLNTDRTNFIAAALLDYAGNPYGTWDQREACIHCNSMLGSPVTRTFLQRCATRLATWLNTLQRALSRPRPTWLHVVFERRQ